MKFWKHSMLAAVVFMSIASTVTYTSCVHDSCKAVICRNGGVCSDEFCMCPDGYEGTQCEIVSREKFIGTYHGQIKVNNLAVIADSAIVTPVFGDTSNRTIKIKIASRSPEEIIGVVLKDEVLVNTDAEGKSVIFKWIGDNLIEVLIEETVDGKKMITNFQATKSY